MRRGAWQKRYFVLSHGRLEWCDIENPADEKTWKGSIDFSRTPCMVEDVPDKGATRFMVRPQPGRVWSLFDTHSGLGTCREFKFDAVDSEHSLYDWVRWMREHIEFGRWSKAFGGNFDGPGSFLAGTFAISASSTPSSQECSVSQQPRHGSEIAEKEDREETIGYVGGDAKTLASFAPQHTRRVCFTPSVDTRDAKSNACSFGSFKGNSERDHMPSDDTDAVPFHESSTLRRASLAAKADEDSDGNGFVDTGAESDESWLG
jgi:hypothetical protein